jgi:ABC-type lipoprotein release transport system permease subunit
MPAVIVPFISKARSNNSLNPTPQWHAFDTASLCCKLSLALGGAAARDVIGLVMKEGLRLAFIGLVVGLGLSFAITRLMRRLLFEVSPTDPMLYSGVALFICGMAALACFVPALRATRIDPMQALRAE